MGFLFLAKQHFCFGVFPKKIPVGAEVDKACARDDLFHQQKLPYPWSHRNTLFAHTIPVSPRMQGCSQHSMETSRPNQ